MNDRNLSTPVCLPEKLYLHNHSIIYSLENIYGQQYNRVIRIILFEYILESKVSNTDSNIS